MLLALDSIVKLSWPLSVGRFLLEDKGNPWNTMKFKYRSISRGPDNLVALL